MPGSRKNSVNPSFKVLTDKSNNQSIIDASARIHTLVVEHAINKISSAEIYLTDGNPSQQEFTNSNSKQLRPGQELTLKMGYNQDDESVFTGIIMVQGIRHKQKSPPLLYLELKHPAVKMTHSRKNAIYPDKHDGDILNSLLPSGITAKIDSDFKVTHKELVRVNITDWDFMVTRAEANGKFVYTNVDGSLAIQKPEVKKASAIGTISYGDNVIEVEAEVDARSQYNGVTAYSWDYTQQTQIDGEAPAMAHIEEHGSTPSTSDLAKIFTEDNFSLYHAGRVGGQDELKAWAGAKLQKSLLSKIRGRVKVKGKADYFPGQTIALEGFSDVFNGAAFVSAVRHEFRAGSWTTDLQFGVDPEWFVEQYEVNDLPSGGILSPARGLHIGTVKKAIEDPDSQFRVQVQLAFLNNTDALLWARVANPDAGKERGIFFRPQAGDEVVIGFVNEDPRDAIVLGALFNKDKMPPPFQQDENKIQGIKTVEGLTMELNDEVKSILLETPNGNTFTLTDEDDSIALSDANGNSITMSSDGITLKSAKDLILEAGGNVKISGVNVEAAANAQFKAEGTSGLEVSSSAITVVKGSLVQIN
jgi:Rhs element Vgr protein